MLGKVRLVEDKIITGDSPAPDKLTDCGDPKLLAARLTDAVCGPDVVGSIITEIVQLEPAATLCPQVLVSEKELALAPSSVMPFPFSLRFNCPSPVFVAVMVCEPLGVPTETLPNETSPGAKLSTGEATTLVQPRTILATFKEPRPVARSYPLTARYPPSVKLALDSTPILSAEPL